MTFIGLFLLRRVDERVHRSAQPARAERAMTPVRRRRRTCAPTTARGSSACERDVRAVDDVSLQVAARRDLRPGRRIELRQDHADQDHRRAPSSRRSRCMAGSVTFHFAGRPIDMLRVPAGRRWRAIRWTHLSYIMQGSMSVLNPVRRVRHSLRRLRLPPYRPADAGSSWSIVRDHLQRAAPGARGARRLSARAVGRHAPARDDRAGHGLPARVHHRRRADHARST